MPYVDEPDSTPPNESSKETILEVQPAADDKKSITGIFDKFKAVSTPCAICSS